ncbi:MAG: extracellular solute-binding protein [Anaerolineae bacterium]|nr:extracellular solute-binding protein [Anaerolineae bacterium]
MKSKTSLSIIVLLVAAMLLSTVPALGQDAPLRITWWGSQDRHDRTIEVIGMYEEATGVDIEYEFSGWGDYWTRVSTQAAGNELACIMQHDYRYLTEWQSRGLIIPLDEYIESGVIDTTNIPEAALASGRVGGELYGFNLGNNSQTFLLDLDAFEAAGVELPAWDWTWEDFEEIALKLHEELDIWAIGPTLPDIALWASLYLGHGEPLYNEDGSALGYEDDQILVDYMNMIMRLQEAGAIPTQAESGDFIDVGPEGAPLVSGDAAMDYRWSNQVVAVASAAGEDRNLKLWTLPRPVDGQSQNYLKPSMFFSITSQCETPEAAAEFINYFVNDLAANDVLFAERGVPVSSAVREHMDEMLDPVQADMFSFLAQVAEDASPIQPPDPPGAADLRDNVYTPLFVEPVLFGLITPEEGAAILREEANAILAANAAE